MAAIVATALLLWAAPPAAATLIFQGAWGTEGQAPGQFEFPEGVAGGAAGDVYVADSLNDRVQRFDADGNFLTTWGTYGTAGDGKFSRPLGIATDFAGNVYVVDSGNNRVQKFDANGVFIAKWGTFGSTAGRFNGPNGIDTDATGNVYVADSGNNRIQKFDSAGNFLLAWGTPGGGNSQFNIPSDVAVDAAGTVYVTDSFNYRVKKFDSNGAFLSAWGIQGAGAGQFNYPYGIEVESSAGVLVSDTNNHRVQRFTTAGTFISATGTFGSATGQFMFPAGIGTNGSSFYVADANNHRIQRFRTGGLIVVRKDAVPDHPQDFTFTAGGGLSPTSFQLDDDGNTINELSHSRSFQVDPGSGYSISEDAVPGWDLDSATCSDGSPPSNIDVSDGETVTCTFTNSKRAQIVVVQDSQPNDPQDFDFTAGGGLSPTSFQLDDDGDSGNALSNTQLFDDLVPGSGYSVAQTTPAGWEPADVACSDGSAPSNIDLGPGEVVTCTFTNLSSTAGRIVVVKDAQPDDAQDFSFTTAGGIDVPAFQLDDDGDTGNALSNSRTLIVAPGGGYSVAETQPSGWFLASATCSDGSPVSNIDVAPSETVTCTFTNQRAGRIVVVKDAQPDDPQDFSFTAGGGLSPTSFQLDDDGDNGNALSNTRTFADLVPGSGYSISEDAAPAGWDAASATCSDGSPPSDIDVGPDETVTCTFTNRKRGRIVVVKDAQPDDPQDFSFTAGGGLSPTSFQLDDDGDNGNALSSTRTFDDLVPGSGYSISEDPPPAGWDNTGATCSDGSPPANVDVAPGETVTCTFTNRRRGSLVVVLDAQPDDPQDFSFSIDGGLGTFALDDDGDNGNALSNTRTFTDVVPGAYTIDQSPVATWLQQATCDDGSSPSSVGIAPGETVTCTFAMSHDGRIVVVKDATPNAEQDFSFTAGGGLSPSSFQLDDDGSESNGLASRRAFIVAPGSGFSVAEPSVPPGWRLVSEECSDGSPTSNIDVSAGETVTCTFVNNGEGYARPKGATPLSVPLVPAFNPCTTPNRTHGPPLAFPSCNPPVQQSTAVTVGTPDFNGAAANSANRIRFDVLFTPGGADDTDVRIDSSFTDMRCRAVTATCGNVNAADGPDYTGALRGNVVLRITDRDASSTPATVVDIPFTWEVLCTSTASTSIGGQCLSVTTFEAIVPGSVREGGRSVWELEPVRVTDGGLDGDTSTTPNTLFLTQGVFVS